MWLQYNILCVFLRLDFPAIMTIGVIARTQLIMINPRKIPDPKPYSLKEKPMARRHDPV